MFSNNFILLLQSCEHLHIFAKTCKWLGKNALSLRALDFKLDVLSSVTGIHITGERQFLQVVLKPLYLFHGTNVHTYTSCAHAHMCTYTNNNNNKLDLLFSY